ncbi:hypothetical protein [Rubripirellula reticaptiva]|nr:hypothetical protein [Rubripirellula reticaptiva]
MSDSAWRDMTTWLPRSANAVLAIDAEAMFQSEIAVQNDWRELHAENFDRNPTMLPPPTERFVLSTELDTEHFEPTRELAVISTSTPVDFIEIQKQVQGEVDTIAGMQSIHTVRDSYVVPINQHLVALIRQGSRQWAAQQLKDGRDRTEPQLSQILADAVEQVASGVSQIVVAVDLADAIPRSAMTVAIGRSGVLSNTALHSNSLVDEMTTLQGFVFSIDLAEKMNGKLEMVFAAEPTQLATVTKPIMLELLASAGAILPEFKQWRAVSRPRRMALQGELSVASLRRVLSLLVVESTGFEPETSTVETAATSRTGFSPEQIEKRATTNYVKRVMRLAESVVASGNANSLREQVLWTDRSAKAISRMSTRNVAYDVAKLGRRIAYEMLRIVSVYQEADQNARSRIASENPPPVQWHTEMTPYRTFVTPQGRFYRYRPFSYAQVFAEENAIHSRQIISEELAKANEKAKEISARIESGVLQLNRTQ